MKWSRSAPFVVIGLVLSGLLVYGFWPVRVRVDVAEVVSGPLLITIDEDGKTRVREKYIVSAPVTGNLFRIELQEGDTVKAGQTILAYVEPSDPSLLDARAQAEAQARVSATAAAIQQSQSVLDRAQEELELAQHEYERAKMLIQQRTMSPSEFDQTEHRERMARADLRSAEFGLAVANFEHEQAKAALIRTRDGNGGITLEIPSPVNGQVLRVLQENAGVVSPGMPLLEIGDLNEMEMEIDVLSTDAVKISPGARVIVEHWGGDKELQGQVRLVEPAAFLKVSALGVDEQRVNVIADFTSPYPDRVTLGDGYRIEAQIVVEEVEEVTKVAAGSLFRKQDSWFVFRIAGGRAALTPIEIGKSNGLETEIIAGVQPGDRLILHPTNQIKDGTPVKESS